MATGKKRSRGIQLITEGNGYPKVPLNSIEIVERPPEGQEHTKVFFNPRKLSSFTPESMAELYWSIRTDELLEPLVVRVLGEANNIQSVQLLAGERRLRTLMRLVAENVPCYSSELAVPEKWRANTVVLHEGRFAQVKKHGTDGVEIDLWDDQDQPMGEAVVVPAEELLPTQPASKLYGNVACKVLHNITDERAMRVAMTENQKHRNLTIAEEIEAVERLTRMSLRQQKIAYMLATNITWVSQTSSFREELPEEAFDKLMKGEMSRNVAVNLLGYRRQDRAALYEATVKAEEEETRKKILEHQLAQEQFEDQKEILEDAAEQAESAGDAKAAKQRRKKAQVADKKAHAEAEKRKRAEEGKGVIKQGHIQKAAATTGIQPKKAKVLPRPDIEAFVATTDKLIGKKTVDPICQEVVPDEALRYVKATAEAILGGQRDPLAVVRTVKVGMGKWTVADTEDDPDAPEDEDDTFDPDQYDPDEYEDGGDGDFEEYEEEEDSLDMETYMQEDDVDNWE